MAKMGRPTDALKHKFQRILEQSGADAKFKRIMAATEKEDVFLKAYDMAHDRAYGKALQSIETSDVTEQRIDKSGLEEALRRNEEALRNISDLAKRLGMDQAE